MEDSTSEHDGKFIAIKSIGRPVPWAVLFYPGTIFDGRDLLARNNLQKWIEVGVVRRASHEEVNSFSERFPTSDAERIEPSLKLHELRKRLAKELKHAVHFSSKAALCIRWIRDFLEMEAAFQRAFESLPPRSGLSAEDELAVYVNHARKAKIVYDQLPVLKEQVKKLVELLIIEAQPFSDLPPTPLIDYLKSLEYDYLGGVTPTWRDACDYLERLRFKFQHREPRPGLFPWIQHKWKRITIIVTAIAAVTVALAKIVDNFKQIRNDVNGKPTTRP